MALAIWLAFATLEVAMLGAGRNQVLLCMVAAGAGTAVQ
jgi:hypothetical protein